MNNALPRFAPTVATAGEAKYYWFAFHSNRRGLPGTLGTGGNILYKLQVYVAAVVVSGTTVSSTGAILLPQGTTTMNYYPAWQ